MSNTVDVSKHTPGPWTATFIEANNRWDITNKEGQFTMFIAETFGFDSDEQDAANAALIAQAPALLKRVKELEFELDKQKNISSGWAQMAGRSDFCIGEMELIFNDIVAENKILTDPRKVELFRAAVEKSKNKSILK